MTITFEDLKGNPIMHVDPLRAGAKDNYSRNVETLAGLYKKYEKVNAKNNEMSISHQYIFNSREDIQDVIDLFDDRQGRLRKLWFPTWRDDLILASGIQNGQDYIKIEDTNWTDNYENVSYIDYQGDLQRGHGYYLFVALVDGTYEIATISSGTAQSDTLLQLDDAFTRDIAINDIEVLSFLLLGRFDLDTIEINYLRDDIATIMLSYQEVADSYRVIQQTDEGGGGGYLDYYFCYDAQNSEVYTICTNDDPSDYLNYGFAGDTIHDHVACWGKWFGTPFYTGQSIIMETPDEIAPYPITEGVLKSWTMDAPYDVEMTLRGFVFSFPADYAYGYVYLRHTSKECYMLVRVGSTYPYDILIQGWVRAGGTYYGGSYIANVGKLTEIPAGQVRFRLVSDVNGHGYMAFFNNETSSWQSVYNYPGNPSALPNEAVMIGAYVTSGGSNPEFTCNLDNVIVSESTNIRPTVFRLGNHAYRNVKIRFTNYTDFEASEDNGLLMSVFPADLGTQPNHMIVSDPPYLEAAGREFIPNFGWSPLEGELWQLATRYEIEDYEDGRHVVYFEVGHMNNTGYDVNGYASKYNDFDNDCFVSNIASAVKMAYDGTYNTVRYRVWNSSGVLSLNTAVAGPGNNYGGEFKVIHAGYNEYEFYFDDTLIYTWEPTAWYDAGYKNGEIYVALGYNDGYSNCKCRWIYSKTSNVLINICDG